MRKRLDLGGDWHFRCVTPGCPNARWAEWHRATVPGVVHTDLLSNGLIPEPFYADNERVIQPVHEQDWQYRREFDCSGGEGPVTLVCEGLDTVAEVRLNGNLVGQSESMFLVYRWDVTRFLQRGRNTLEVTFRSPLRAAEAYRERYGLLRSMHKEYDEPRLYIRKAQYAFGWDWGPAFPTVGIWRPIYLEVTNRPALTDVWAKVLRADEKEARLAVSVELNGNTKGLQLQVALWRSGTKVAETRVAAEPDAVTCELNVTNPDLWWPNGYGAPALYDLVVRLVGNGEVVDERRVRVGLRTVQLVLQRDGAPAFAFKVNGREIFAKGADWIPADSFLPRVGRAKLETLLRYARDAHMNMLRVWGGGIYEDDAFYDLCDELGLLVWQDFAFACGVYPEDAHFLDLVRAEVEQNVRRLRNHPSVALWCGNNECEWIWRRETQEPVEHMPGYRIFHDLIPEWLSQLDDSRPYWPTSPWGDPDDPDSETTGNRHQWDIWSRWVDYREVKRDHSLFVTEFGFQGPANRQTLEQVLPEEERWPQSRLFEFHNKQVEGTERLFRFLAGHLKVETDFGRFIHAAQLNQALALKTCVEHWRSGWPRTAGVLIWQLNDCWPVTSWALIDSNLIPKAAYYWARRFFSPILLLVEVDDGVVFTLLNDTFEAASGELLWQLRSTDGQQITSGKLLVEVPAQTVRTIRDVPIDVPEDTPKERLYILAEFRGSGFPVTRARTFFVELKHLQLPVPHVNVASFALEGRSGAVELEAKTLVLGLQLELPGAVFADNFFDLEPGQRRRVDFDLAGEVSPNRRDLKLTYLR